MGFGGVRGFVGMVLVLDLGSHDEELGEEAVKSSEAGEVVGMRAAGSVFGLVNGAEERLATVSGAGVCRREEGVKGRARDGGRGLGVRRFVTERDAGVGAEEGKDEEAGEEFEGASGIVEAGHFTGRGMRVGGGCRVGEGRHGSFRLGTASHGWVGGGAGSWKKYAVRCARKADSRRECQQERQQNSNSRFPKGMTEEKQGQQQR
jgi:hypothetical protein